MRLGFDMAFPQLYAREGLAALDAKFIAWLKAADVALHNRLLAGRAAPEALERKAHSELLMETAPHAEDFLAELFGIARELNALRARHHALAPLYACKRLFVQRRAAKAFKEEEARGFAEPPLPPGAAGDELDFARAVMGWLAEEEAHKDALDMALRYAAWALFSAEGKARHAGGVLFKQPHKLDYERLIPVETERRDGVTVMRLPPARLRKREGFALTDAGGELKDALDHAHYCIYCHHQGRDSCSKGMREKDGAFKKSPLEVALTGCPLEEKISEMNELKSAGVPLGALAVVCVDNPMCAGTGHRICNDCMKSCIYQKQEPVNIPLTETHVLRDVLALPYGFEIYSLLTRWNPLHLARPLPKPPTGRKVLVAGMGPAGYTLAHHLLNDGHTVVGIDGLKIEPLPERLRALSPVRDISELWEALDERAMAGFGGVAEYGITVRWDKNFLKVIRLLLERRDAFALMGGVRFGGQIDYEKAFALGFDHIALCLGAGKPTLLDIPNGLARGVRTASDFLMSLQLTGASRKDSIANLQLRLPAMVVGGGLTAVDAATEALAYYPVQVEKFLSRYEALAAARGEARVRRRWSAEETEIAEEFLSHARAIRAEREAAAREGRQADIFSLLDAWGGVKIIYRKRLIDAPSYRLNHEEVEKAFEEGMFFAPLLEPAAVEVDAHGAMSGLRCRTPGEEPASEIFLPARTLLIAAGTGPNTVLAREDAAHFKLDGRYFRAVDEAGNPVSPERSAKPGTPRVLMSVQPDGRAVSFFGDLHPSFAGNVVKAMGSAKQGYPVVTRVMEGRRGAPDAGCRAFLARMREQLSATVHAVNRLTPTIVEVVIHAPLAAAAFQPGQFYRLQNFEAHALTADPQSLTTTLSMEGLAMTGAWVDKKAGLVSVIALEMGGSSDLCAHLKPGEPVVLMGPTGTPTHIPAPSLPPACGGTKGGSGGGVGEESDSCSASSAFAFPPESPRKRGDVPEGETVLLAGGGLGNAVLFSIGAAMRAAGCRVLYFAGYRTLADRYKEAQIEKAADVVVWCCDEGTFTPGRPQDFCFHGNIVEAMAAYGKGALGESPNPQSPIPLSDVTRILAIGSDRMMAAVAAARHGVLKPFLRPDHAALASVNSPMQCMMKEICAQCLQKHLPDGGGPPVYVYSCFNQDQCLDRVSFPHLAERLQQNAVQEKLTAQWVDFCLERLSLRAARL